MIENDESFSINGKIVNKKRNNKYFVVGIEGSLNDSERIMLGVIISFVENSKYGFCDASDEELSKILLKPPNKINSLLHSLRNKKYIILENEYKVDRKIWTPLTWKNREEYLASYEKDLLDFLKSKTRHIKPGRMSDLLKKAHKHVKS